MRLLLLLLIGVGRAQAFEAIWEHISITVNFDVERAGLLSGAMSLQNSNVVMLLSEIPVPVPDKSPDGLTMPVKFLAGFKKQDGRPTRDQRIYELRIGGAITYCGDLVVGDPSNGVQRVSILYKPAAHSAYQLTVISPTNYFLTNIVQRIEVR